MHYPKKWRMSEGIQSPNRWEVSTYRSPSCVMPAFDVEIEDFRHKARLVAGGHIAEKVTTNMYAYLERQQKQP